MTLTTTFCITRKFCYAKLCIRPTHFSPNTVISPSHRDSNRLKTHVPQNVFLIRSQTLYPAELRARVEIISYHFIELKIFRPSAAFEFLHNPRTPAPALPASTIRSSCKIRHEVSVECRRRATTNVGRSRSKFLLPG
jgi:hypothetical protein